MTRTTIPLLLVLSTLAAMPREALAGPPIPGDTTQSDQEADALFHKGSAAFDAGKTEQAYQLYLAAWKLKQTRDIAGNLAQVELKLGKTRDAAEHIAFAVAHFPPSVSGQSDRLEKMKRVLDGLRKSLGTLRIRVSIEGAKVSVDGKAIGEAPIAAEVFVEPGAHRVEVNAAGYQKAEVRVEVAKGATQEVAPVLVAAPKAPPPAPTPASIVQQPRPRTGLLVAGGATSGAALIAGVLFTIVSTGKASDAAAKRNVVVHDRGPSACAQPSAAGCQSLHDDLGAKSTFGTLAGWTFVASGVVAATTLVYALAASTSSLRVMPAIGPQQGGLVINGVW